MGDGVQCKSARNQQNRNSPTCVSSVCCLLVVHHQEGLSCKQKNSNKKDRMLQRCAPLAHKYTKSEKRRKSVCSEKLKQLYTITVCGCLVCVCV